MAMAAIGKRSPLSLTKGGARTACEMVRALICWRWHRLSWIGQFILFLRLECFIAMNLKCYIITVIQKLYA